VLRSTRRAGLGLTICLGSLALSGCGTRSTDIALIAAQQVGSCEQSHQMTSPSASVTLESGAVKFEECSWPAIDPHDPTGYTSIVVSGSDYEQFPYPVSWPGELTSGTAAAIIETSCPRIRVTVDGSHTGTTWSWSSGLHPGELGASPNNSVQSGLSWVSTWPSHPTNASEWASLMGVQLMPGDSVLLYNQSESVVAAVCVKDQ